MTIERRDEGTTAPPGLRGIDLQPGYDSSDKVLEIFYVPALSRAVSYDRSVGYFRSSALSVAARGLSRFINGGGQLRLLCGAEITESDRDALLGHSSLEGPFAQRLADRLLTDNERVLARWAREFGCSAGDVTALLANVGTDVAGAVQYLGLELVKGLAQAPEDVAAKYTDRAVSEFAKSVLPKVRVSFHCHEFGVFYAAARLKKLGIPVRSACTLHATVPGRTVGYKSLAKVARGDEKMEPGTPLGFAALERLAGYADTVTFVE